MIEPAILHLLRELSTDERSHTDGTLFDHLAGTHDLLERWRNERSVSLAGLFHSIYGTQSYTIQSASLADREKIRDAIGERAERLAYLFCVSRRSQFFEAIVSDEPTLLERIHKHEIRVTRAELRDLIEMEMANYVEFMPRTPFSNEELDALALRVGRVRDLLSDGAYESIRAQIANKRDRTGTRIGDQ